MQGSVSPSENGLPPRSSCPAESGFEAVDGGLDGGVGGVGSGGAEKLEHEEGGQPVGFAGAMPGALRALGGEDRCAEAFVGDADADRG